MLYHGSRKKFSLNFKLEPQNEYTSSDNIQYLEDFFENLKPQNCISRKEAVYLSDNLDLIDVSGGYTDIIYEVSTDYYEKSDLAWYTEAQSFLDNGKTISAKKCAENYWNGVPFIDEERSCFEYRAKTATVINIVEINVPEDDLEFVNLRVSNINGLKKTTKAKITSKIPLILYHGTNSNEITEPNLNSERHPSNALGLFFSSDKEISSNYGKNIFECVLNIENPYVMDFQEINSIKNHKEAINKVTNLKNKGYDGIFLKKIEELGYSEYIVFDNSQIITINKHFNNTKIKLYHGTSFKNLENILKNGFEANEALGANWYVFSSDFSSALFHASTNENEEAIVIEFDIPIFNNDFSTHAPYLWNPYHRNENSCWFAAQTNIPPEFINKVHKVPYEIYKTQKISIDFKTSYELLNQNNIMYSVIQHYDLNDFLNNYTNFENREFIQSESRRYIVATNKNKEIVGYACLVDNEKNNARSINGCLTLSNIEVLEQYRNKGIATNILNIVIDEVKKEGKILRRTAPDLMGKLYIYERIGEICNKKGVDYVPHNLTFIYESLSKNEKFIKLSNEEKIESVNFFANKILEHEKVIEWDIRTIDDINSSFYDIFDDVYKKNHNFSLEKKTKIKF